MKMNSRLFFPGLLLFSAAVSSVYFAGRYHVIADDTPSKPVPRVVTSSPSTPVLESYLLPFQGRLTDAAGIVIPAGRYDITFGLYLEEKNGTARVTCARKGVEVGPDGSLDLEIDFAEDRNFKPELINGQLLYLGLRVDNTASTGEPRPEMSPRIKILPVLYARNAGRISNHDWKEIDFRLRRLERLTQNTEDPQPEAQPSGYPDDLDYRKQLLKPSGK
jgi:hypothetical protein